MARARTLVLDTRVNVTGEDKLRGLGRTLSQVGAGLTAGVTLPLIGFGAAMVTAAQDAERAQAKLTNVFDSMGAAAFTTVDALNEQAKALQAATTFDDESITEFQAVMLTFGNVTGTAFDRAIEAGLDMSALLGQDLQSSAIQLGKALNDPIRGITALTRVGVSFTEQQKEQIRTLQESGDVLGAQTIILDELERQFGGTAEALAGTVGGKMTQAMNQLGEASEQFGEIIAKPLGEFAERLEQAAIWLQKLNPETREWVIRIGILAAVLGPALIVLGQLVQIFSFLGGLKGIPFVAAKLKTLATALGVSRLALLGWTTAIVAAGVAVGQQYGDVLEGLSGQILRDFARQHGIAADKVTSDVARIAESLGVDIPEAQERLLAAMDGNADSYDRVVRGMVDSTNAATGDISEALLGAGSDWEEYQNQISGAMFDEPDGAVPTITGATDAMADEMGEAPGKMADALLAAQFELTGPGGAIDQLVEFMDQALSPAEERYNARAFLASQAYQDGLNSGIPSVIAKAEELAADAQAVLDNPDFFGAGQGAGYSFGYGLVDPAVIRFVSGSAARLAAAARGIFPDSEPKDPRSPLRGITKGFGFGEILARGFLTGSSAVQGAMRSLVGGGIGALPSLSPAAGGGAGVVNNFYLRWDGEPPKGRNEEEIIGNLQRLSPLVGLVGGS